MKTKKNCNKKTLVWIYGRTRRYLPLVVAISVLAALSSFSSVTIALLSRNVLDCATGAMAGSFKVYGVLLFALIAFQVLLYAADSYIDTYATQKLTISIRSELFASLCKKKYPEIAKYHSGDILNRFTSDIGAVVDATVTIIPSFVSIITQIISGIGAMLLISPKAAVIILAVGIVIPAVGRKVNKRFKHIYKEGQNSEGVSRSFMQECFENITLIKTFSSEAPFVKRLNEFMSRNFKIQLKKTRLSIVTSLGLYAFFTAGYYAVLLWGAGRLSAGIMTFGTLTAFLQLFSQIRSPLQSISGIIPRYYSALASAERLTELSDKPDDIPPLKSDKLESVKNNFSSLEVRGVSFGYGDERVLSNLTFEVKKGETVAVTGESGSGKSTFFKLLLGLYEVDDGKITVNGSIGVGADSRGIFAYVPQGNMILSGSLRDNLTLCDPEADDEKLEAAMRAAEIYEHVSELPDGLDTVLSERGAGFSEGQLQRISIARALMVDAPVLLLDEATSALDEETETRVLNNIKKMTDKTVLFITHRNTSLRVCDRIIKVD